MRPVQNTFVHGGQTGDDHGRHLCGRSRALPYAGAARYVGAMVRTVPHGSAGD